MSRRPTLHKQTTLVTCSDNGKSMTADVISFDPKYRLVVSLEKLNSLIVVFLARHDQHFAFQDPTRNSSTCLRQTHTKSVKLNFEKSLN